MAMEWENQWEKYFQNKGRWKSVQSQLLYFQVIGDLGGESVQKTTFFSAIVMREMVNKDNSSQFDLLLVKLFACIPLFGQAWLSDFCGSLNSEVSHYKHHLLNILSPYIDVVCAHCKSRDTN